MGARGRQARARCGRVERRSGEGNSRSPLMMLARVFTTFASRRITAAAAPVGNAQHVAHKLPKWELSESCRTNYVRGLRNKLTLFFYTHTHEEIAVICRPPGIQTHYVNHNQRYFFHVGVLFYFMRNYEPRRSVSNAPASTLITFRATPGRRLRRHDYTLVSGQHARTICIFPRAHSPKELKTPQQRWWMKTCKCGGGWRRMREF